VFGVYFRLSLEVQIAPVHGTWCIKTCTDSVDLQTYLLVILLARGHRSHRYMYARMKYDMKSLYVNLEGCQESRELKDMDCTGYRYFQTCLVRNLARHNDIPGRDWDWIRTQLISYPK